MEQEMKIAIVILLATLTAAGQTAKVIQLEPADAAQAKLLHEQAVAAAKKEVDFMETVRWKYLKSNNAYTSIHLFVSPNNMNEEHYDLKSGWGDGTFEFSEDFRFIVPSTPQKPICTGIYLDPVTANAQQ